MYQEIYGLLVTYIYGGELVDSFQQLVCTEVATFMCILCFAMPFFACLGILKAIFRW
jgi:hypothetical protein